MEKGCELQGENRGVRVYVRIALLAAGGGKCELCDAPVAATLKACSSSCSWTSDSMNLSVKQEHSAVFVFVSLVSLGFYLLVCNAAQRGKRCGFTDLRGSFACLMRISWFAVNLRSSPSASFFMAVTSNACPFCKHTCMWMCVFVGCVCVWMCG